MDTAAATSAAPDITEAPALISRLQVAKPRKLRDLVIEALRVRHYRWAISSPRPYSGAASLSTNGMCPRSAAAFHGASKPCSTQCCCSAHA